MKDDDLRKTSFDQGPSMGSQTFDAQNTLRQPIEPKSESHHIQSGTDAVLEKGKDTDERSHDPSSSKSSKDNRIPFVERSTVKNLLSSFSNIDTVFQNKKGILRPSPVKILDAFDKNRHRRVSWGDQDGYEDSFSSHSNSSGSKDDLLNREVDALYRNTEDDTTEDIEDETNRKSFTKYALMKVESEVSIPALLKKPIPLTDNSFTTTTPCSITQNFAAEHRIFLRAILSLLIERDQFGVDAANANDPQTIKAGSLKKASHVMKGVWKNKYVEIRRGLFSYYDDNGDRSKFDWNGIVGANISEGHLVRNDSSEYGGNALGVERKIQRKSLPLRANLCTCRAVKMHNNIKSPSNILPFQTGYIFELTVEGGAKRLWMTNSREERQAWIQAIHNAMIGGSVTHRNTYIDYTVAEGDLGIPPNSPYRNDLEIYISVQREIQLARTAQEYLSALQCLFQRHLKVPVQWIKEQMDRENGTNTVKTDAFGETSIGVGISQLWKDMLRDSVEINGVVLEGDKGHGPERIIGALVQNILKFDKLIIDEQYNARQKKSKRGKLRKPIKEFKAVSIARDVLLSANRTRSAGDSYFCIEKLCSNRNLVVLCPFSTEAESLKISLSQRNFNEGQNKVNYYDCKGWIKIRHKITKRWKKRYCVLGEGGVLSYYEKEKPRPHGLRAQIILLHAKMEVSEGGGNKHVVTINTKDRSSERQFCFENDKDFSMWQKAFQKAIDGQKSTGSERDNENNDADVQERSEPVRLKGVEEENALGQKNQAGKTKTKEKLQNEVSSSNRHPHLENSLKSRNKKELKSTLRKRAKGNRRGKPSFYIQIQGSTSYKICTTDPDGVDEEDTWATVQTKFLQSFRVTGSRLHRGEEIVEMNIVKGLQN